MKTMNMSRMDYLNEDEGINRGYTFDRPIIAKNPAILASTYDLYLTRSIDEPFKFDEWFSACEEAQDDDIIIVHINSFGGCLETALQIHDALLSTKATVHIQIEGACCSGASIIAMAGHRHIIAPNAYMMIHSWTGGTYGKFGNVIENSEFQKKWFSSVMFHCYKDFLSEKEIEAVLDGKDIWLDSNEVQSRYNKILENRKKEAEKNIAKINSTKEKINKILESKGLTLADLI